MDTEKPNAFDPADSASTRHKVRSINARDLFAESNIVFIEYRGESYQLRQTRNGKLILTK